MLLRKKIFNSLLAFFFWKACTFLIFERFLCLKSRNYSQHFSLEIYLSRVINYWGITFTLCWTWGAFSLVCVLSVFFFSLLFFFFCLYFPWQILTIHRIAGNGEGHHQLTNIQLVYRDLYHFFLLDYQTDSWWDLFSLEISILFAFLLMQFSRSYWLWHFKVTLWGLELISNYHPSITQWRP